MSMRRPQFQLEDGWAKIKYEYGASIFGLSTQAKFARRMKPIEDECSRRVTSSIG
ncbi:MAG: hypothetical protein ACTSYT_05645 [Candidatus Asgardarchaeia archaeon]